MLMLLGYQKLYCTCIIFFSEMHYINEKGILIQDLLQESRMQISHLYIQYLTYIFAYIVCSKWDRM